MRPISCQSCILLCALAFAFAGGCQRAVINRKLAYIKESERLFPVQGGAYPFLKAHMKNGSVFVLKEWSFNDSDSSIVGTGSLLDLNRETIKEAQGKRNPSNDPSMCDETGANLKSHIFVLTRRRSRRKLTLSSDLVEGSGRPCNHKESSSRNVLLPLTTARGGIMFATTEEHLTHVIPPRVDAQVRVRRPLTSLLCGWVMLHARQRKELYQKASF